MPLRDHLAAAVLLLPLITAGQSTGPEVTSWILNPGSETGYSGILSNVLQVQYDNSDVYVSCTCIPGYDIGPWAGNPNDAENQDFNFKITRAPAENTGTPVATPMGHIGVWRNGVSIFNAKDGMSYQGEGIWNQNAIIAEGASFDLCNGHPAPNGEYHHHLNPNCLYDDQDDQSHAPVIGYAFDGFPIYGAYGFANVDGSGPIQRIRSSYRLRDITERHTLPDGTVLQPSEYGPAIGGQYPLGYYLEDHEFVDGSGDLDEHNGRFCVTPQYPDGIYAYFVTLDSLGEAAYPYTLGPTYYGLVQSGNTGPQSGHNTVPGGTITWDGTSAVIDLSRSIEARAFPNPASDEVFIPLELPPVEVELRDLRGTLIRSTTAVPADGRLRIGLEDLPNGSYVLLLHHLATVIRASVVVAR